MTSRLHQDAKPQALANSAGRILGIDPGTLRTGFGVVESRGSSYVHLHSGVIAPGRKDVLPAKLHRIYTGLREVIDSLAPHAVAVEQIFTHRNARSALLLGHARGIALLAAAECGLPIFEYAPAVVKKAVTGYGRADKQQVMQMVSMLLGLAAPLAEDASDALAVAICHLNHGL